MGVLGPPLLRRRLGSGVLPPSSLLLTVIQVQIESCLLCPGSVRLVRGFVCHVQGFVCHIQGFVCHVQRPFSVECATCTE